MKKEQRRSPKIALCRECKGTGRILRDDGEAQICPQCEGSGRVTVSCEMTLDIRPYKPRDHK
ncbi:MAG: molecular chaperone DnaJ [Muribaculaceae bacterium]|nr:molecular chaperone DnaJ [Muribaculaceae bacterium]